MNPSIEQVLTRPFFYGVDQAQAYLKGETEKPTPWTCAQKARAFLFLAKRSAIAGKFTLFKSYWSSAKAMCLLGKRIKKHGSKGNIRLSSDFHASDRFLFPKQFSPYGVEVLRQDFFAITQIATPRQALEALDEIAVRSSKLRAELISKIVAWEAEQLAIARSKVDPPSAIHPSKIMRRVVK